jgi:hypothetical protein
LLVAFVFHLFAGDRAVGMSGQIINLLLHFVHRVQDLFAAAFQVDFVQADLFLVEDIAGRFKVAQIVVADGRLFLRFFTLACYNIQGDYK